MKNGHPADGPEVRCSRCGLDLPRDAFRLDSHGRIRSWCIACGNAANREWRARRTPEARDALAARRREAYRQLVAAGLSPAEAHARR